VQEYGVALLCSDGAERRSRREPAVVARGQLALERRIVADKVSELTLNLNLTRRTCVRRFVSKRVSFAMLRGRRTSRIASQCAADRAMRGTILATHCACNAVFHALSSYRDPWALASEYHDAR
jgi:hypothetical protein